MDAHDLFVEIGEFGFTFGLYKFLLNGKTNLILPFVSIQLEADRESIGKKLTLNNRLFLKVESLGNQMYTYIIHGDHLKSGIIFDAADEEIARSIFFDFLITFQVPQKIHLAFQEQMKETGFWTMCVETSIRTYVLIHARSACILDILDGVPSAAQRALYQ
ncbi:MAG: hypothetical protein P4L58_03810 [Candidatus Pacebacteria bacterium]|nr:hypothetical protein [Candidatus Paceibacterota bacterium]